MKGKGKGTATMQRHVCRRHPALPRHHAVSSQGFTLIELMVTLAVAAILLAIATPSFTSIINSNRLASAANEMVAVIQTARMEAVRRNTTVSVCAGCDGNADSLVAYVDANDDDDADAGEIVRVAAVDPAVQLTAGTTFEFRPDGFGRESDGSLADTAYRFCIPTTKPTENIRVVTIGSGSRISTEPANGGGACT